MRKRKTPSISIEKVAQVASDGLLNKPKICNKDSNKYEISSVVFDREPDPRKFIEIFKSIIEEVLNNEQ